MRVPSGEGRGLGSGSWGWWGGGFAVENKGKRGEGGCGGGTGKGTASCQNYPLANNPLVSPPKRCFQGNALRGTGFLEVWGLPRQTSKKFALEGFRMEIPRPRQLLKSSGILGNFLRIRNQEKGGFVEKNATPTGVSETARRQ